MKQNKLFIHLFIILIVVSLGKCDPYCEVVKQYQNTKIFTSVGEKQDYYLDDYFQGFNLDYKIVLEKADGEQELVDTFEANTNQFYIQQSASYKNADQQPMGLVVGKDMMIKSNGDAAFSILTETEDQFYNVYHGKGTKTQSPVLENPIELPYVDRVQCFGVTKVSQDVNVVDCVQFADNGEERVCKNYFYITNHSSTTSKVTHEVINNCYLNYRPFGRKTVKLDTSHDGISQIFIIQAVPFDMYGGKEETRIGYINIFRYVTQDPEDFANGQLIPNSPITKNTFQLSKDLQIADFDVIGNIVYILDYEQGVIFFEYKSNQVVWFEHFLNGVTDKALRFGMSINWAGSTIQMLIAEASHMKEYQLLHYNSKPELLRSYDLDHFLTGTIHMESSADFIVAHQGRLLMVYNRGQTSQKLIKAQIENAEAFHLWYSDTLQVFNKDGILTYNLQKPSLQITALKADTQDYRAIKLRAISSDFFYTQTCEITLRSVIISNIKSQLAYQTDYPINIEFSNQSTYQTTIPLDTFWVGPNLKYEAIIKKQSGDGNDQHYTFIDTPQVADFTFANDVSEYWKFNEIIPSSSIQGAFYIVSQNQSNQVKINLCKGEIEIPSNVSCLQIGNIDLNDSIKSFTYGQWGNENNIIAFILSSQLQFIHFYHLEGANAGQEWFKLFVNEGKPTADKAQFINLHHNTLYTIVEGKTTRYIKIYSYIKEVEERGVIDSDTIKEWPQQNKNWYPENIQTNDEYPNVIFVLSRDEVFVISTENHDPQYLNLIPVRSFQDSRQFVSPRAFVLAYADEKIEDFSLQNLNWVSMDGRFEYQAYGFEFLYPFTITHGPSTGLIYVLAFEQMTKEVKCLVYKSGESNIKTLYQVVDLSVRTDQISLPNIAAGGANGVDYVLIQFDKKKIFLRSPMAAQVILTPHVTNKQIYVDNIDIDLVLQPWSGNAEIIQHQVKIVNGQIDVIVVPEVISVELPKTLYANNEKQHQWNFMTLGWWNGSVIDIDVVCSPNPEVCGTSITVEGPVQENSNEDFKKINNIVDMQYSEVDKKFFIMTEEEDSSIDDDSTFIKVYDNDLKYEKIYNVLKGKWGCDYLEMIYDDNGKLDFVLVYCWDWESQIKWEIYKLHDIEHTHKKNTKTYLTHISVEQNQYQYFRGKLYINSVSNDAKQGLYILDISVADGEEDGIAEQVQMFNYLNPKLDRDLRITNFLVTDEVPGFDGQFVKVIMSHSPKDVGVPPKLVFMDLDVNNSYNFAEGSGSVATLDFQSFVIKHNLFVTEQTRLTNIKLREAIPEADESVEYIVIVMTDNTALYEISLKFDMSIVTLEDPTIYNEKKSSIKQVFNNYGVQQQYNIIETLGQTMVLGYYNSQTRKSTAAFYSLKSAYLQENNVNGVDENAILHPIKGGYVYNKATLQEMSDEMKLVLFRNSQGNVCLATTDLTDQRQLKVLNYEPDSLKVYTKGDFEKQKVDFLLKNDFTTSKYGSFSAMIDPNEFIPVKPEKGYNYTWVIVVCSVIGVIIIAGLVYWLYKRQQKQTDNGYEIASENGYSLQAPVKA